MNSAAALAAEARSPGLSDDSSPRIRSSRLRSFCRIFSSSSRQELLQPVERLLDRLPAAGIREAHETRAVGAVEIDARARGHTGFVQHAPAEPERVIGEAAGIRIGKERAVALVDTKAQSAQSLGDQRTVGGVVRLLLFAIVAFTERRGRGYLAQRRRRDEEVLLQDLRAAQPVVGQHPPADA